MNEFGFRSKPAKPVFPKTFAPASQYRFTTFRLKSEIYFGSGITKIYHHYKYLRRIKMNNLDEKSRETHIERECRLHGRCGKDAPLLTLLEVTVFGLNVLSKSKKDS
jgi:hypothetical protein